MKKVLIISYYWPPSGGIGVLRNLKFVKYLRKYGWEPIVYVPEKAHYPYLDHSNDKDIPEGLTVLKQPIIEPHGLFKKLSGKAKDAPLNNPVDVKDDQQNFMHKLGIFVRGNFFIPDARFLWIRPSVSYLKKYLKENPVDMIFTDGPPHTCTRIATLLKKEVDVPWVSDFQDPWSQVDYLQRFKLTKWAWRRHRKMEQEAFEMSNAVTVASPTWCEDLERIGAPKSQCLYYGFDEDDFKQLTAVPDKKFTMVHAGLLGADRNPTGLFEAIAFFKNEGHALANDISLKLIGQADHSVLSLAKELGIDENIEYVGTLKRADALQQIFNSQTLLLPINKADNAPGRIPAKIFEYLRSYRPILAFGPQRSDIGDIIRKEKAGFICDYDDVEEIKNILLQWYNQFKKGELGISNDNNIADYTNEVITGKLATIFDETLANYGK